MRQEIETTNQLTGSILPRAAASAAPGSDGHDSLTVYFDGACPLCRAEINHYRKQTGADALSFVDVSKADAKLPAGLDRIDAMARFHVADTHAGLRSGAAAFVLVWEKLPRWQWAARLAKLPGAMLLLEGLYRLFLPVRPFMSRLAIRLSRDHQNTRRRW
ncbi:MAG: DUF393 domain-containing protein [Hyphomicrobiaceae bacterium]|nr:DUF393 domain-containing protein [Hyphomicrobiaceae bacterium]